MSIIIDPRETTNSDIPKPHDPSSSQEVDIRSNPSSIVPKTATVKIVEEQSVTVILAGKPMFLRHSCGPKQTIVKTLNRIATEQLLECEAEVN